MATARDTMAAPPLASHLWHQGWFSSFASVEDVYPSIPADGAIIDEIKTKAVQWALDRLPDDLAEALRVYEMGGATFDDACAIIGISRGGLSHRLGRARRLFEVELRSLDLPPAVLAGATYNGISDDKEASMGRNKDQGTTRERNVVNRALSRGLFARRAENNLEARDVEIVLDDATTFIVEVKARQALSIHPTLKRVDELWGDVGIPAVSWHRLVKREDAKRRVQAGPELFAVPLDRMLDLLKHFNGVLKENAILASEVESLKDTIIAQLDHTDKDG